MQRKKIFKIIFILILIYIVVKKSDYIKTLLNSIIGGASSGIESLQGGE